MSQDLVKALGVDVMQAGQVATDRYVLVRHLQSALEKLPVVTGYDRKDEDGIFYRTGRVADYDTHTARIFAIEEIKREPVKVEFDAQVFPGDLKFLSIIKRSELKKFEGKVVRVTVEEIVGE